MNIKEAIQYGIENLEIEDKLIQTRMLLSYCLRKPKEYLLVHDEEILPKEIEQSFKEKIELLQSHFPIQYITKEQEFYRRKI